MTIDSHLNPDHGQLSRLAREDPAAFEALRQSLVDQLINSAPDRLRSRLAGLQFRLDDIHRRSSNPLAATVRVYQLMWSSFLRLNDELLSVREPVSSTDRKARVIEFRPRNRPMTA